MKDPMVRLLAFFAGLVILGMTMLSKNLEEF